MPQYHEHLRERHPVWKDASCREIEEWSCINWWRMKGKTQLLNIIALVHAQQHSSGCQSWVSESSWMPIFSIKKEKDTKMYCHCISTVLFRILYWLQYIFHRKKCAVALNGSHDDYLIGSSGENLCLVFVFCEPGLHPDGADVPRILVYVITKYN